eukprot:SM000362S13797  [mRNA]  locus=s362:10524:11038:- [translate_table: standard]
MPITTDSHGRHHRRTLDIVGVQPGGGPRALVDVVVTEAYKSSASTHIAGHAVGGAEQRKLQHCSDYPRSDQLLPAAVDTFGCMGPRFHILLEYLASLGYARRYASSIDGHAGNLLVIFATPSVSMSAASSGSCVASESWSSLSWWHKSLLTASGIRASRSDLYVLTRHY